MAAMGTAKLSEQIIKELVDSLKKLKSLELSAPGQPGSCYPAEKVLEACYHAGKLKVQFNENQQKEVGSLVKDNIKKLDACIFNLGYSFDPNRGPSALIFRSGLQFMLDNFKDFPTGTGDTKETLGKELEYFKDTESLETFDEALQKWKDDDTVGEDRLHFDFYKELKRPSEIPASHTWWF